MIHNPEHRIAKMMREIRAFDPYAAYLCENDWTLFRASAWVVCASRFDQVDRRTVHVSLVLKVSQKPERCVRQALKQVRKFRGKR